MHALPAGGTSESKFNCDWALKCSEEESGTAENTDDVIPQDNKAHGKHNVDNMTSDSLEVDTSRTWHLPGGMHIISNATHMMGASMKGWKSFICKLTVICNFVRRPWSKQRLQDTCFSDEPACHHWPLYEGFSAHVHPERWGTVCHAAVEILTLELSLRASWTLARFMRAKDDVAARAMCRKHKEDSKNVDWRTDPIAVDAIITSDEFWGYTFMVSLIATVINRMFFYLMSCACHSSKADFLAFAQAHKDEYDFNKMVDRRRSCVLTGHMLPELVAGDLDELLGLLWSTCFSALRMDARIANLVEESRTFVLVDFSLGRQAFVFYVRVKWLHPLTKLPLVMAGVAVYDWTRGRRHAAACCKLIQDKADGWDHPSCAELEPSLLQFAAGAHPCQALLKFMGKARASTINETAVEGLHAYAQKGIRVAPHHGPVHIALCHHLPPLKGYIAENPSTALETLAKLCSTVRSVGQCLTRLDILAHPPLQPGLQRSLGDPKVFNRHPHRTTAINVIYHADSKSIFQDVSQFPDPLHRQVRASVGLSHPLDLDVWDRMQANLMVQHITVVYKEQPGRILLLPTGLWNMVKASLIAPWDIAQPGAQSWSFCGAGCADLLKVATAVDASPWIAFSLVHHNPADLILSKHSDLQFCAGAMVVSQVPVHSFGGQCHVALDRSGKDIDLQSCIIKQFV